MNDGRGEGRRRWTGWLRPLFSRIRTVLFLSYFVIIMLCITLLGTVSYLYSSKSVETKVENAGTQIVSQIQKNIDNDFQNKRNLLLAPYYNKEYIDGIVAYPAMNDRDRFLFGQKIGDLFLRGFYLSPLPDFVGFQIYFSDGEQLFASDNRAVPDKNAIRQSDWFAHTVAKDGKVYFSGPYADGAGDADATRYASNILIRDFSNGGSFIIVRAEYNVELFQNIGRNANISATSRVLILNDSGQTVYASGGTPEDNKLVSADVLAKGSLTGGTFWNKSDAGNRLVTFVRSPYSNWFVVLLTPKNEIFDAASKIKTTTLLTAGLAFLVTSLISVLFARRITSPILQLYKTVNHVKRGDLTMRVDIDRSDEIGRIAVNFNAMVAELQHLIRTKYVYQIKLRDSQLAMLHAQINPHFLYNTLDSIRAMADYHRVPDVAMMAESLADMFRYNTKQGGEWATLREELKLIADYMQIQRIRFGDKLAYETDVDDRLLDARLLKMTLQPLAENAVYHGLERKKGKGTLRLSARLADGELAIEVSDDGVGIAPERMSRIQAALRAERGQDGLTADDEAGEVAAAAAEAPYRPGGQTGEMSASAASDGPFGDTGDDAAEGAAGRRSGIGLGNVYARYAIRYGERFRFRLASEPGRGTTVTLAFPLAADESTQLESAIKKSDFST